MKAPFWEEMLTEGRIEGRIEARRADVEEAIRIRFGDEAGAEVRPPLEAISDLERLSELHRLAIRCRRISDFRRALSAGVATG